MRNLIESVPDKINIILTDKGLQLTNRRTDQQAWMPIFDRVCREHQIEHPLTNVSHPWTNGPVDQMNRTLKEATVHCYHDDTHEHQTTSKQHLYAFVNAYNFAKRLKALKGLTPYEFIVNVWQSDPERFILNLHHHIPGLNT